MVCGVENDDETDRRDLAQKPTASLLAQYPKKHDQTAALCTADIACFQV